jgi:hypothetical protein
MDSRTLQTEATYQLIVGSGLIIAADPPGHGHPNAVP